MAQLQEVVGHSDRKSHQKHAWEDKTGRVCLLVAVQSIYWLHLDLEQAVVARSTDVTERDHAQQVGDYETLALVLITVGGPGLIEAAHVPAEVETNLKEDYEKGQQAKDHAKDAAQ